MQGPPESILGCNLGGWDRFWEAIKIYPGVDSRISLDIKGRGVNFHSYAHWGMRGTSSLID